MKFLKNKTGFFSLFAIFIIPLFFTACEQDGIKPTSEISPEENQKIMDALCNHMHDCNDIEVLENAVVVDKCMHIDKANMLDYLTMLENGVEEEPVISKVPHPLDPNKMLEFSSEDVQYYDEQNNAVIEERQRILGYKWFAKNSEVTDLKYSIHKSASDCHSKNLNAINEAIGYWNSITNCRVKFSYTSNISSADIVFGCDSDKEYRDLSGIGEIKVLAQATFPNASTRKVGKYISINDSFVKDNAPRKAVMIHEIGHCLGLAHTNDKEFGYHLPYSSENDEVSLMNSWYPATDNLSKEDLNMVRRLWPQKLEKPINFSLEKEGKQVRIKCKNPNIKTGPYYNIRLRHWYNGYNQQSFNFRVKPDVNGNFNFLMPGQLQSGTHYFNIQGVNHYGEVGSSYTGWENVNI